MNPICLNIGGASHHLDSREEFRLAFQRFLQPWVIDNIVLIIILTSELSLSRCYSWWELWWSTRPAQPLLTHLQICKRCFNHSIFLLTHLPRQIKIIDIDNLGNGWRSKHQPDLRIDPPTFFNSFPCASIFLSISSFTSILCFLVTWMVISMMVDDDDDDDDDDDQDQ